MHYRTAPTMTGRHNGAAPVSAATASLSTLWAELRIATRALSRARAFTVTVLVSLVIGVALNSGVFMLIDALLLRSLPYQQPEELLSIQDSRRTANGHFFTLAEYEQFSEVESSFSEVAAYRAGMGNRLAYRATSLDGAVEGTAVSGNTFGVLGAKPLLGRTLLAGEERAGSGQAVVISYGVWQRHFLGATTVLGTLMDVDGAPYTIVGVMPRGFWYPFQETSFWISLETTAPVAHDARELSIVGRLRPDVSPAQAISEATVIGREFDRISGDRVGGDQRKRWFRVVTLDEARSASDASFFFALQGIMACVLLLACLNVSNLSLARALSNRRSSAIRAALGASRWSIVRNSVAEMAVLGTAAAVLGVAASVVVVRVVAMQAGDSAVAELLLDGGLNARLVGYVLLLAVITIVGCSIAPVAYLLRTPLHSALRDGGGTTGGSRTGRVRGGLVVAQIACSLTLLIAAAAFVAEFDRQSTWNPGFTLAGLVSVAIGPDARSASTRVTPEREMLERISAVPGVQSAAAIWPIVPASGRLQLTGGLAAEVECRCSAVSESYFTTMDIPVLAGRDLSAADYASGAAVVDEEFALRLGGARSAVGAYLRLEDRAGTITTVPVVGVVRSIELSPKDPGVGAFPRWHILRSHRPPTAAIPYSRESTRPTSPAYSLVSIGQLLPWPRIWRRRCPGPWRQRGQVRSPLSDGS